MASSAPETPSIRVPSSETSGSPDHLHIDRMNQRMLEIELEVKERKEDIEKINDAANEIYIGVWPVSAPNPPLPRNQQRLM